MYFNIKERGTDVIIPFSFSQWADTVPESSGDPLIRGYDSAVYLGTSFATLGRPNETVYYDCDNGSVISVLTNSDNTQVEIDLYTPTHHIIELAHGSKLDYYLFAQPFTPEYRVISYSAWTDPWWNKHNVNVYDFFDGIIEIEEEFHYGEISVFGGGSGGSFDNSSDSVDFSSLPSGGGASASGLVTMFHPTASQMAEFGAFLWGGLFNQGFDGFLTSLKKWVNDPIESIIQLAAMPVTPPTGTNTLVKFCGIASNIVGDGVYMNRITSQFMTFDFGQIQVPAYWKQALDYTPYSKVSIFLPFCGIQPLNADDIIDATLHLKYNIDLLTGIFSAELKVTKNINGTYLNSVLYNWSGNMAVQIPITASNFSQVFGSLMSAVAGVGIGAISGGLGAAAGGAEATKSAVVGGALTGAGHGLASNIGNVVNSKPHVQHSGRLDGSAGALSSFTPYLIIERPVQSLSAKFQSEQGYPSNVVQTLGDLEGMTVCEAPILDGINCTDDEKTMINNLLCGGVII